jgi:antitoxin component YwqK of YwqJK toxin-antitoxin module
MKAAFFLALLLVNCKLLFSQDTIKYYRFTTAKYADVIIYNDSVSRRVFYNFFGKKIESYTYLYDSLLHGEAKGWYANGKIKYVGNFKYNKKDGKWFYWYRNGKTEAIEVYNNGVPTGTWYIWFRNGKLLARFSYKNGLLDGEYVSFFINGQIDTKAFYVRDTLDGKYTEYYENGNKRYEVIYDMGEQIGIAKEWSIDGTLTENTKSKIDSLENLNRRDTSKVILPFNKK